MICSCKLDLTAIQFCSITSTWAVHHFFSHLLQKRSGFSINRHILSMNINSYSFHTESCMKYINVFLKHVGLNRFSHMRQVLRNLTLIATTRTQAISVPQLLLPLPHPIHNHPLLSMCLTFEVISWNLCRDSRSWQRTFVVFLLHTCLCRNSVIKYQNKQTRTHYTLFEAQQQQLMRCCRPLYSLTSLLLRGVVRTSRILPGHD
jgi:hypothetical protein